MHVAADDVAGAAARLIESADAVARAAAALGSVTISPSTTGPRYRAEGARVSAGIAAMDDALAAWCRHTATMARALAEAGAYLRTSDTDAAAGLARAAGTAEHPGG